MKDIINYEDFLKLDFRIGEVVDAENLENSNKLIKLTVDFAEESGNRTILTGMQKWYQPEDFKGKKFMFLVNLAPRKMAGSESQGMIIAAELDGSPKLIEAPTDLPPGTLIR